MGKTEELPSLPEGYRLDLASDPHAPALRRPNGVVVARFGAWGMTHEAVEREAWGDLLYRNEQRHRGRKTVAPGPSPA